MSLMAIPDSSPQGRKWAIRFGVPIGALAILAIAWWAMRGSLTAPSAPPGQFYTVIPMDLETEIKKDGELAAINNIDIMCEVEGQTTIQTIVPEGSSVKKGDVLCTLDSSAIKQKIEDTTLDLQKAEADLTTSKELKEIQESQNSANLEAADVALTLAQLDLQAYTEGIYPQDLQNAQTALEMAKITLKNKQEKLAQTKALFGKGFVNATDVKNDELELTTANNELAKAESALKVLTEYSHAKDMADKKNALSQAEQKLVRTKRENAANLNQRNADVQAKTQGFEVMKRRMEHLQDQFASCTINAPADGMVVYASGDRWSDVRIQEGASVRERQTLMRLPDTSGMKVVSRIGEAQVGRITPGLPAKVSITSIPRLLNASVSKISVLADSGGRFYNPDTKEYPVDLVLDETPQSLKPGMGAQVVIQVSRLKNVLAIPLAALYSAGPNVYAFTRDGDKAKPVRVKIGQTNETHVEIRDGLNAGDQVLLLQAGEGRDLLEANGIKIEPTTRGSDDFGPRRGRGGGGNRNGGGGNGGGGNGGGGNGAGGANADGNARPDAQRAQGAPATPGDAPGRRGDAPTTLPVAPAIH
jgi:HlyD family secretion protein